MTSSVFQPASMTDMGYLTRVLLFIAFISMGYALSRPYPSDSREDDILFMDTGELDPLGTLPWQRKVSEKAIEKYAAAQDRKWQRWNEAMFERKG